MSFLPIIRRRRSGGGSASPLAAYAANGVNPATVADFENDVYLGGIDAFSDFTESGTSFDTVVGARRLLVDQTAGDTLALGTALVPAYTDAFCVQMVGEVTYADNGLAGEAAFLSIGVAEYMRIYLRTQFAATGGIRAWQYDGTLDTADSAAPDLTPGTNVPFALAVRFTSSALQVALNGAAGVANDTPTAMPDTTGEDMDFVTAGVMRLRSIIIWNEDIGEAGIEEASSPAFFT